MVLTRWRQARFWPDLALAVALLALAAAVRLPNYMTVPVITDETREVLWGLRIAQGQHLPLTSTDPYDGPLFPYLIAGAFRLFGLSPELPRLVVLALGALTIPATYLLGRMWGNRTAGLIGAGLMATASTHILINSHIAWSNATSPFFTTLSLFAFAVALARKSAPWYVGGGFLFGLALQTHPSVVVLAPAVAFWLALDPRGRPWLRTRWPWLALVAALVAYSPVLVHNALNLEGTQTSLAAASRREYAFGLAEGMGDYTGRLAAHSVDVVRAYAAHLRTWSTLGQYFTDPVVWLYAVLLGLALLYAVRRRIFLPPLAFLFSLLLMAVYARQSEFPAASRYVAFLLPLGFLSIGLLVEDVMRWVAVGARRWPGLDRSREVWGGSISSGARWATAARKVNWRTLVPIAARMGIIALLALNLVRLGLYPLYVLSGVEEFFLRNGPNSGPLLDLAARAREAHTGRVWIDAGLGDPEYWMCNGVTAGEALSYLLILNDVPVETLRLDTGNVATPGPGATEWVALKPANLTRLESRLRLNRVVETPPSAIHCAPESIGVYVVQGSSAAK